MGSRLLPGGECLLVEAPAVNYHRAAVVLRAVICRDGVFKCRQDGTLHPTDVVRVVTHCLAVVRHQLVDGRLLELAEAPTSEGDASLLPRCCQLAQCSSKSFGDVVYAFLPLQLHVSIHLQAGEMPSCTTCVV